MKKLLKIFAGIFFSILFLNDKLEGQSFYNRYIPDEAHKKMGEFYKDPISVFSMTPSGGWVMVTKKGRSFARNIPGACYTKMKEFLAAGHQIEHIAFPPKGGDSWVIITDRSTYARNIPDECYKKINEYKLKKKNIKLVVFPKKRTTDNTWLLLADDGEFFSRNIDDECYQIMRNLSQSPYPGKPAPRKIHHVAFEPDGGWLVIADDYHFARNINQECFTRMNTFRKEKKEIAQVAFTPDGRGWSIISNGTYYSLPDDPIRSFETNVGSGGLWDRMREIKAPGLSVAVVMNGRLVWSAGYGHLKNGDSRYAVHPETMFQAASVSKVLAAVGAFELVETGKITLDRNLQSGTVNLNIPTNTCFKNYTDLQSVTIRNILNHQSGIMGNGTGLDAKCLVKDYGGYGGYSHSISYGKLPTINQIISGSSPANSPKITITYNANALSGRSYSGPGFTMLQKLTEDFTGLNYASWMKSNILTPMGMSKSRFVVNPENIYKTDELTWGWDTAKNVHVRNRYPEFAAAGLWSNVEELANLLIMLNNNGTVNGKSILSSSNATTLRGGVGVNTSDGSINASNSFYAHGGVNLGYRAYVIGFPTLSGNPGGVSKSGIVVMTNVGYTSFRYDVVNAIIKAYGW